MARHTKDKIHRVSSHSHIHKHRHTTSIFSVFSLFLKTIFWAFLHLIARDSVSHEMGRGRGRPVAKGLRSDLNPGELPGCPSILAF